MNKLYLLIGLIFAGNNFCQAIGNETDGQTSEDTSTGVNAKSVVRYFDTDHRLALTPNPKEDITLSPIIVPSEPIKPSGFPPLPYRLDLPTRGVVGKLRSLQVTGETNYLVSPWPTIKIWGSRSTNYPQNTCHYVGDFYADKCYWGRGLNSNRESPCHFNIDENQKAH